VFYLSDLLCVLLKMFGLKPKVNMVDTYVNRKSRLEKKLQIWNCGYYSKNVSFHLPLHSNKKTSCKWQKLHILDVDCCVN